MFNKFRKHSWFCLLLVLVVGFFSYRFLLSPGYFPMHDDMQPIRLLQMDKCFRDGQFPCRWVPDLGYGYGYPLFIYYSPLAYYLMEIFHLSGWGLLDSIKAEFIATFVFSGFSMFLLGRSLWGKWSGLIAAIFYLYAPFRAADVFTRGAVGEFTALIFLPLIFWSILKIVRTNDKYAVVYLGLSFAGLLLTHNITSLIFTPYAIFWSLFWLKENRAWKKIKPLVLGSLLGVGLSAFFILPALLEKKFVHVETMTYGYFNYLAHFVSLRQLFFSGRWGFGSSELGPFDDLNFSIGLFHWFFALLALVTGFWFRKKDKLNLRLFLFLALMGLSAAFMTHQRSSLIWEQVEILKYLQFPWRFLGIIFFAFSLLAAGLVKYLKQYRLMMGLIMIFLLVLTNAYYFRPAELVQMTDEEKLSAQNWQNQVTASIYDYLPIFAASPPDAPAGLTPWSSFGDLSVINFEKGTDWQKARLIVNSEEVLVYQPLFYFPGFELTVDGSKREINYQNKLGLVSYLLESGDHEIYVKLKKTPIRCAADLISLISTIGLGGWLIYEKKKKAGI